ncbi:hypothetical protein X797_009647 [Metarhizium robertsii]|uniref:Uncharacterized protein n=1 Tax=Metarhizium robertsii TaxID=568076 RepID=A0A0A1UQF2_9HYPO|nr:hypothetical protein X797_009647 [Metarhizium robertsii]
MLAIGTCVLWLLVAASAARLDEQHLLSHANIEHGAYVKLDEIVIDDASSPPGPAAQDLFAR